MNQALPLDIEILQNELTLRDSIIQNKDDIIQGKDAFIAELQKKNELLLEQFLLLKKFRFGQSSEKWTTLDKQQSLLFDEAEQIQESAAPEPDDSETITVQEHTRNRKKRSKQIPDTIPRVEQVYDLSEEERRCTNHDCPDYASCTKLRPEMGRIISEELEFIPATIRVIKNIQVKYGEIVCNKQELDETAPAVITAEKPKRMIPGSIASPSLLAYVCASKFADSLPLYRQERLFSRIGIELSRQTMSNWIIKAASGCEQFMDLLFDKCREGPFINMDETSLQVLHEPFKPVQSKSYMWVMVGHYEKHKLVLFSYFRNRTAQTATILLKEFSGALQTDGYSGYNETGTRSDIWHVGCWAHARRKFYEAAKASKKGQFAQYALRMIKKLYAIEKRLRLQDLSSEEFVKQRRTECVPVLRTLKSWLKKQSKTVVPESLLGKAISYTLNEYIKLVRYLKYAFITPDNNLAERSIKPFTVGRKNWLFFNTPRAYAGAVMYSLVETAKANNLEPYHYLMS